MADPAPWWPLSAQQGMPAEGRAFEDAVFAGGADVVDGTGQGG